MSLGDAIRGLIDPLHPAVREWLRRELPRLVAEGYVDGANADLIARRYGVRLDAPLSAASAPDDALTTPDRPLTDSPAALPPTTHAPTGLTPAAQTVAPSSAAMQPSAAGSVPLPARAGALPPIPGAPPATAGSLPVPLPRAASAGFSASGVGVAGQPIAKPGGSPFLADHAVSIVLYLGAFLVVAAVVIFLTYSWGDISGGGKLGVLAGLTAGFLAAAGLCLPRPAVRPAGRTFLALGAILVPANIAATYVVYFEDTLIPAAVFWLVGAFISGGLYAALSLRLPSKAYGALAVLSVPVGAAAISWLVDPRPGWIGSAAALGLIALLVAVRRSPPVPLVQAARALGSMLLPLAFLVSLPFLEERSAERWGPVVALMLVSAGLAWEATRRGATWWIGAAGLLLCAPFVALGIAMDDGDPWFGLAAAFSTLVAVLTARVMPRQQRVLWDIAAIGPAALYPFVAWEQDWACLALFASLAVICGTIAWGWRSTLPLYALVLAVDGTYVKLLAIFGSPDSPEWSLGVALWPLGVAWAVLGLVLPRRLGGPGWVGALVTLAVALLLVASQPAWSVGVAATGAIASVLAAWRLRTGLVLPLAVPWLLVAGYQGGEALNWSSEWAFVLAGVTGWLLMAVSLLRPALAPMQTGRGAPPGPPQPTIAPAPVTTIAPATTAAPAPAAATGDTAPGQTTPRQVQTQTRPSILPALDWAPAARLSAVAVAGFAALLLLADLDDTDRWLNAATVGWLNLTLMLTAWAALSRSRTIAILAALSVVPALVTAITRLHPDNAQAYALPIGLYLLAVAAVTRRLRGHFHREAATAIAALGMLILLGVGIVQSLDNNRFMYVLLTLGEGLALVGLGIAIRWRVLVVGGVAGTVIIALRQLFDAVAALPGWAILGGSGMLLLGAAVALLLARARLAAARRSMAERWSGWD